MQSFIYQDICNEMIIQYIQQCNFDVNAYLRDTLRIICSTGALRVDQDPAYFGTAMVSIADWNRSKYQWNSMLTLLRFRWIGFVMSTMMAGPLCPNGTEQIAESGHLMMTGVIDTSRNLHSLKLEL